MNSIKDRQKNIIIYKENYISIRFLIFYLLINGLFILFFNKITSIKLLKYIDINKLKIYLAYIYICTTAIIIYILVYNYKLQEKYIKFREETKKIDKKLKQNQELYSGLYYNNYLPIFIINPCNGNIVDANKKACFFYGYSKEEFIKLNIIDLNILPCEEVFKKIENAKNKKENHFYFKHKLSNGDIKDVEVYSGPIEIEESYYVYSIVNDITDKKKVEERLKLFEKLLENNTEGVIITDKQEVIQWVNPAFSVISGYNKEEVLGKTPSILKSGKHDSKFYKNMWRDIENKGKWCGEIWNKKKCGNIYLQQLNIFAIRNSKNEVTHFGGIIKDITENKCREEEINYLAYRDSLTGLYNRAFFIEKLEICLKNTIKNNEVLGVIFMDLDGFKKVNDNLGHGVGDELLKQVSKRLKSCVRAYDIISRLGGDEFTFILPNVKSKENIIEIVQRIMDIFEKPYKVDECKLYISASIGISLYPYDGLSSDVLIKNADIAMYSAKESGKSRFVFYSSNLNEKIEEEFTIENSLRYALKRNELFINYQPIIDIKENKIIGVEALLRWKNAKLGIISPDKFIPIAEKNGFISEIGEWVLRNSCKEIKRWHDKGFKDIFLSVNISVIQLKEKNFVQKVSKILKETKINPIFLDLEITESIYMENIDYIIDVMNKIKDLKVNISMDDFGTGYSSLSQLKNLYISKLKIDKSFIKDIYINSNSTAIASAVIAMAKKLNIKVIAEGVETDQQLKFLKDYGCDMVQGYLFSPPVDAQNMENIIKNNIKKDYAK